MLKYIRIAILLLISNQAICQNLVANPKFEDINNCCENKADCSYEAWFLMSTSLPTTFNGTSLQLKKGDNYLTIPLGGSELGYSSQCIATPLLCSMRPNEQYEIMIQVEPRTFLTTIIEALFTDTFSVNIRKQTEASVTFKGNGKKELIYDKKKDLITLTGNYTANGSERYLMLGLFSGNPQFKCKYLDAPAEAYRLKYIRVTPKNHTLDCDTIAIRDLIYNENRRHNFATNCSEDNTNLFPYLINNDIQIGMEYADPRMKKAAAYKKVTKPIDNVLRNLNFDTDDATLKPEAYKEVSRLVVIMYNNSQKKVTIIGYTDNTGSEERNLVLSVARAKAVADYLVRKGVKPERIQYEGKGASNAIDSNDTEEGRSNNRRVEFFLTD